MTMELVPSDPEEQEAFERIALAISELRRDVKPASDWQERVLAKVRAEEAAKAAAAAAATAVEPLTAIDQGERRWSWRHAAPAMCAAAIVLLWWAPWRGHPVESQLLVEMEASSVTRRGEGPGEGAQAGSTVTVSAVSTETYRAVWIYRRNSLVISCPGAGCTATADRLSAALTVELVGEYTAVALWSSEPLPQPSADRDAALAAATRSGATVQRQKFDVW